MLTSGRRGLLTAKSVSRPNGYGKGEGRLVYYIREPVIGVRIALHSLLIAHPARHVALTSPADDLERRRGACRTVRV